jgi:hypothetical protein
MNASIWASAPVARFTPMAAQGCFMIEFVLNWSCDKCMHLELPNLQNIAMRFPVEIVFVTSLRILNGPSKKPKYIKVV